MKNIFSAILSRPYVVLISAWVLFEVMWYVSLGLHFDQESLKYILQADNIIEHHSLTELRYIFYGLTIAVITAARLLHIGLNGAVLILMVINLFSYLYFLKALIKLFSGNTLVPLIVIMLLLSFWPYQSWTLYLYSESAFYSMVMLLFAQLILFREMSGRFLISTAIILLLTVVSRPLGILFVFPVLFFIFFHLNKKQKLYFYLAVLGSFLMLNYVVQIVFTTTSDWSLQKPFLEENLICDLPTVAHPQNLILSQSSSQLYQLIFYITHNFSHFSHLALLRLKLFFLLIREYYSAVHNAYLLATIIVIYLGIIIGIRKVFRRLKLPLFAFTLGVIFFFSVTIAMQCDDWHNRFYLTLMPLLVTMAAGGIFPEKYIQRSE